MSCEIGEEGGRMKCKVCGQEMKKLYRYWCNDINAVTEESHKCEHCNNYSYEFCYGNYNELVNGKEFIYSYKNEEEFGVLIQEEIDKMIRDEFKIKDKVWDFVFGHGEIISISDSFINVKFTLIGNIVAYKLNGRTIDNMNGRITVSPTRTLFFQEIPIPKEAMVRPKWRANKGDTYFLVSTGGTVEKMFETHNSADERRHNVGNYFQTAEKARESKFYKAFHEGDNND